MPNRILKETIRKRAEIDCLTPEEEVFYYRLLTCCDDFGLMDARPIILRAECFPLKIEVLTNVHIENWLARLAELGLVMLYIHKDQPYLKMTDWENDQQIRAKRSKYPEPNGHISPDSIGNQMQSYESICPRNPIQSNPIQIESNHVEEPDEPEVPIESSQEEPKPARAPQIFEPESKEYKIAAYLRQWILKNNPGARKLPKLGSDKFQKWCKDVDLMLRVDERPPDIVWRMVGWCQADTFWRANILSTAKLRDKYDTLILQMERKNSNTLHRSAPALTPNEPPEPVERGKCENCNTKWELWPETNEYYCPNCEPSGPSPPKEICQHNKVWDRAEKRLRCPKCEPAPT